MLERLYGVPRSCREPNPCGFIVDYYLKDHHEFLKSYTTHRRGRVHLVLQGSTCNLESIKSVKINKQEAMNLPGDKKTKIHLILRILTGHASTRILSQTYFG